MAAKDDKCAHCGACKHCGNGGAKFVPYPMPYPVFPPQPNPYPYARPYWSVSPPYQMTWGGGTNGPVTGTSGTYSQTFNTTSSGGTYQ